MLEYGIQKSTNQLVHVDAVENGKRCDCICPHCKDQLIARNNPNNKKRHSFAHQNIIESRACLMTQLHLVAQQYFYKLTEYRIPQVRFEYQGAHLDHPGKKANVTKGLMEHPVGKYISDVFLETEAGDFVIEIYVTHECEEQKKEYFKENKLVSIEYDLSELRDIEIQEVVDRLKANLVPYTWIYPWSQDEMIQEHEEEQSKKRREEFLKQRDSAKTSAKKFIKECRIKLPSLIEKLEFHYQGRTFEKEVNLTKQRSYDLDELSIYKELDNCLILKGQKTAKEVSRIIWVVYQYYEDKPDILTTLQGSIILRSPSVKSDSKAVWRWHNHEKLNELRGKELLAYKNQVKRSVYAERKIEQQAKKFIATQDSFFQKDYSLWRKWMIEKGLFKPSVEKKNPKIPAVFKTFRKHPSLWVFNTWPVFLQSVLAEIIDSYQHEKIGYQLLFNELNNRFPVRKEFLNWEKQIDVSLAYIYPDLYQRSEIIMDALTPFEIQGALKLNEDHVDCRHMLLPLINL